MHTRRFTALVRTCALELAAIDELDGETVLSWSLGDGHVIWRLSPAALTSTRPIVALAAAITRLVSSELEEPPPGHWWTFAFDENAGLLAMGGHHRG